MKDILLLHPKKKIISLIVGFIVYLSMQILSMTLLRDMYVFGWMADHLYCYTWVAVIVLIAFDQTLLSNFVTFGTVCATIVGEFLGRFIQERRMSQITNNMTADEIELLCINYGVLPIWFIAFAISVIVGIVINIILNKKARQASG